MEEREIVFGDIEKAGIRAYEFDPMRNGINEIKEALERVRGLELHKSNEATRMSGLPGFLHLNHGKLLPAVILFRYRTKYKRLEDITPITRNRQMQSALKEFFPDVKSESKKYILLKGDMIRYITLVERNL